MLIINFILMNKKNIFGAAVVFVFLLMFTTSVLAETNENGDKTISEQHKADITRVTEDIEKAAEKDSQIADEVKSVTQEEKDSSDIVKEKMDKIETRSKLKTFLIGSDYKNLGELRSELVTTDNRLERLTKTLDKTTSTTVKAELETKIKDLEAVKAKAESFVNENENKFSLFGWLMRLFNR